MTGPSLLIIGYGDLGQRVATALAANGWRIGAVRRNPPADPSGFDWFAADYSVAGSLDFAEDWAPDFMLSSFTPTGRTVDDYQAGFTGAARNLVRGLGNHRPRRLLMVSSTRVYAETEGGWVDEDSKLSESDERAIAIVEAERQLLHSPHPTTVVRCGGVYGAAPGRLVQKVARGDIAPEAPLRYTNRIHREDAAGFLIHLLAQCERGEELEDIYNCVDDVPAPAYDVETWLSGELGVASKGAERALTTSPVSHKRCRNARLHASGYQLRYPDFRSGYRRVLASSQ